MSQIASTAVIGAGPAGLTAAYLLAERKLPVVVLEADAQVGGISRTVEHNGFRFDIGGHRFYSKSSQINALWDRMLPEDFLVAKRLSRIYYRNTFFSYPLRPFEALRRLGPVEAATCIASYLRAQITPAPEPRFFDEWMISRFGRRLFEIFFQTYTEKVWGMPCHEISSDWAAQRIGQLSLWTALADGLGFRSTERAKTLIQTFRYPRLGPGQLWESCADQVVVNGGDIRLRSRVVRCEWKDGQWHVDYEDSSGRRSRVSATHLISSAPLAQLFSMIAGAAPDVVAAAQGLRYRDFITVCLMFDEAVPFDDQWIYVHDPGVSVGRVQNYGVWSPDMLPRPESGCLGLEYFCHEGDGLWNMSDDALIGLAQRELQRIGLWHGRPPVAGYVVRQPKAYPVYDASYAERVALLRREIAERYPTLHLVGRNGMHRYNNQDHAMMTGMLTAENIALGRRVYDVWRVNGDAEYVDAEGADQIDDSFRAVPLPADAELTKA